MATYFWTTNISIASGTALTVAAGDDMVIAPNVYVATGDGFGFYNPGSGSLQVLGTIFGGGYGAVMGSGGGPTVVSVAASGSILTSGWHALVVYDQFRVTNRGLIESVGSSGWGVQALGSGTIDNHGVIAGEQYGVYAGGGATTIRNHGTIQGGIFSIIGSAGIEVVTNTGLLQGDVGLGDGNDFFNGVGGTLDGELGGADGVDTVSFAGHDRGVYVDFSAKLTFDGLKTQVTTGFEAAHGTAFNDFFFGSEGNDIFDPGASGVDFVGGYGGFDIVSYASSARGMIVDLTAQATWDGAEGDTLVSIEGAVGSRANDTMYGSAGNDSLDGGPGGADTLNGLGGIDQISHANSFTPVIIDLSAGLTWDGAISDVILNFENAYGSGFNDTIYGNGAANELNGWLGNDTLYGGGGADRFVVGALADLPFSADVIADFTPGLDKVAFRVSEGYDPLGFVFISGAAPAPISGNPHLLYYTATGQLRVDMDGSGGGAALLAAVLSGAPNMTFNDYVMIA